MIYDTWVGIFNIYFEYDLTNNNLNVLFYFNSLRGNSSLTENIIKLNKFTNIDYLSLLKKVKDNEEYPSLKELLTLKLNNKTIEYVDYYMLDSYSFFNGNDIKKLLLEEINKMKSLNLIIPFIV
jgi:hypothetical protein